MTEEAGGLEAGDGGDHEGQECFGCGSSLTKRSPYLVKGFALTQVFDRMEIRFCERCGFGECEPEPDRDQVDAFYETTFREVVGERASAHGFSVPPVLDRRASAQILLGLQFSQFQVGDTFMDFGAGGGAGLHAAGQILPSARLAAVELSSGATEAYQSLYGAKNYRDLEDAIGDGLRPKMFLMSHSLEHIRRSDVLAFLSSVLRFLSPGGVFVAEVPHLDMRIHHDRRVHDDPHLLFFSKESLRAVVEQSGFSVVFVESCSYEYEKWWASTRAGGQGRSPESGGSLRRRLLKKVLDALPRGLEEGCVRLLHRVRPDVFRLDSPEFRYGGNRTCLRVVAVVPEAQHQFAPTIAD